MVTVFSVDGRVDFCEESVFRGCFLYFRVLFLFHLGFEGGDGGEEGCSSAKEGMHVYGIFRESRPPKYSSTVVGAK